MELWSFYFLGKLYLHYSGYIRFDFIFNLLFAFFIILPFSEKLPALRFLKGLKFALSLACAFLLLWHETWFPPLLRTVRLLSETGGISPGYIVRFLRDSFSFLEAGILFLIFAFCFAVNKRFTLTPLVLAGIISVPFLAANNNAADMDTYLDNFYQSESKKVIHFSKPDPDRPDFDVIILNICSLAWDDLRSVGLEKSEFLRKFDLLFTNFNTVSSYTNPSAIRLLRANCGQNRHKDLYRTTKNECYVLESLRDQGFKTYAAIDNDAPSYRFVEDIITFGRADKPIEITGLPVLQYDFDSSPIYDDFFILNRWWDMRSKSNPARAALYMDITTLHSGAHWANDQEWWTRDRATVYRKFAENLFLNLDKFFETLSSSGRNFVVFLVPEHGMALRGSSFQPSDIREIPLPLITTVPMGVKLIGPGFSAQPEQQIIVSKQTSYLAISHLLSSFLSSRSFDRDSLLKEEIIKEIPEVNFVAENEGSFVVKKEKDFFFYGKTKKWDRLPSSVN